MNPLTLLSQFAKSYYIDDSARIATTSTVMGFILIPLIILLVYIVFMTICMWKIFKKAGKSGWESIIPFYNIVVMLQITNLPMWYIALLLVPIVQVYALIKMNIELAKKFGQDGGFAVLLMLAPVIGYPILAFSKDKVYMGSSQNSNNNDNNDCSQQDHQQVQYAQLQHIQSQPQCSQTGQQSEQMQQPKAPMNPVKKKKIIMGCCIGGGVLVLGISATIALSAIFRINYSATYNAVKDLKSSIQDLYNGHNCSYVVDRLENDYISVKTYNDYIEKCKDEITRSDLVTQLEQTDGVKRNREIKNQFDKFKSAYDATAINYDDLSTKLNAYSARHNFIVLADDLSYSSSEAEIKAAAKALIDSGNEILRKYGEGWQEKYLAAAKAYQEYRAADSYAARNELYSIKNAKNKEIKDYITANKPDIKSLYAINLESTSKVKSEFDKLYNLISSIYEQNYNYSSKDCAEFLNEVVCD